MKLSSRFTPMVLALICAPGLLAQEVTGTLRGTVREKSGTPVAGARVRLTSPQAIQERILTTDSRGEYSAPLLLPGEYTAKVTKDGYTGSQATLRVSAGAVIRQDLTLNPTTVGTATVEVVAVSAMVDKTQTKSQVALTQEDIESIPLAGNFASRALAALAISPSVAGTQLFTSVRGGASGQAQYLVNGLSVRDNITSQGRPQDVVLDDLIEESQVILSPLNAKYGDSSAGLINIVEKTGTNTFTGSLRIRLDRASWTALRPPGQNASGNIAGSHQPAPTDALNRTYELAFSGPIIKDKLTFTYGTRLIPASPATVTAQDLTTNAFTYYRGAAVAADKFNSLLPVNGQTRFTFHQGRLFWQIHPNHSLDYSHSENFNQFFDFNGNNFPTPDASVDTLQTSTNTFRQITYRGIFGADSIIEARFGKRTSAIKFTSGPGDPIFLRWGPSTGTTMANATTSLGTNGATADRQPEIRNTESATLNYSTWLNALGSHSIDIGMNMIKTIWGTVQNSGGPNGRVFFIPGKTDPSGPNAGQYIVFRYDALVGPGGTSFFPNSLSRLPSVDVYSGIDQATLDKPVTAFYLNDQWTLNDRWSAMLGLRMEQYKYNDGLGQKYSSTTLSPRLEVKWDPEGNNRRVFSFSYGQFRANVHERITRQFSTFRNTTRVTRLWTGSASAPPPTSGPADYLVSKEQVLNLANYGYVLSFDVPNLIYAIDPNFKPDVNHEMVFGFRRAYTSGGSLSANLVRREWKDMANSFGSTAPLTIPDPTNSGLASRTGYLRTLANDPGTKREFHALELQFAAPILPNRVNVSGSYTIGQLKSNSTFGDAEAFGPTSTLAATGLFRERFAALGIAEDSYRPYGELPTSTNQALRLLLVYTASVGRVRSQFSLLGRYTSGGHFNLNNTVTIPSPGLNSSFPVAGILPSTYPHFYNGRGQYTTPDTTQFDFGYVLKMPIKGRLEFFSELAVVNVFNQIRVGSNTNTPGVTSLSRTASGTVQATPIGYRINSPSTYGWPTTNGSFYGARDFNLDIGIRF